MYTFKAFAYLAAILSIIIASSILNNWHGLLFEIPLIAVLAYSLNYPLPGKVELEVKRHIEPVYAIKGDTVKVEIEISNKDHIQYIIKYEDYIPEEVSIVEGSNAGYLFLKPGENGKISYTLKVDERGHYGIGPLKARIIDPLGFRFTEAELGGKTVVSVFPEFENISWFKTFSEYTGVWPGEVHSRKSGQGYDFYGVREYVYGDEFKRINWPATAKRNRLMSNEYESEKVTDVLLVVDAGGGEVIDEYLDEILEFEVSIAASLALAYLRHGNRVGLIVHGQHRAWIKPAFGKKHFLKILHYLADARGGGRMPLKFIVGTLTPYILKPRAEVIIISPLLKSEVIDLVKELLAMDYRVLILSPNPYALITNEKFKTAVKALSLKRKLLKLQLLKYCPVIDWDPRISL
ncbi:MAG: hypothetical protein DRJ37_03365, partial [Thermoprotei archaeon]